MNEVFLSAEQEMKEGVDYLRGELRQVRTGRASTSILEGVQVDYYGTMAPLPQLANLAVADSTLLTVQPYDASQIDAIEKAIRMSDLGLNPSNDGRIIRVPVPTLTEERRKELVRLTHDMAEKARNRIRQARREANEDLKKLEKEKEISEDEERTGHDRVQKLHDHYIEQVAEMLKSKEEDILHL